MNSEQNPIMDHAPEWFDQFVHWSAVAIEFVGVAVLLAGLLAATILFLKQVYEGQGLTRSYEVFRISLARGILLGLEFLVAADIIGTVAIRPTLHSLYILGLIVLIRTFLSFSLETEVEGQWPWKRAQNAKGTDVSKAL